MRLATSSRRKKESEGLPRRKKEVGVLGFLLFFSFVLISVFVNHKSLNQIHGNLEKKEQQELRLDLPQSLNQTKTKSIRHTTPPQSSTAKRFLNFDEAAPSIVRAATHYLSSIPQKHRLSFPATIDSVLELDTEDAVSIFYENIRDKYSSDPNNVFPKKLHLYEINPSIAVLPKHYRTNQDWLELLEHSPAYVASYRVTHELGCFDTNTTLSLWGGDWDHRGKQRTDYLGMAILDKNLNMLLDATFTVHQTIFYRAYKDFRVQNIGEQLYLSTGEFIVPFELSLSKADTKDDFGKGPTIPTDYEELVPAFDSKEMPVSALRLWVRGFASCPPGHTFASAKNLLYFLKQTNGTSSIETMLYPRSNPNSVHPVNMTKECRPYGRAPNWKEIRDLLYPSGGPQEMQPIPTFETMDSELYPKAGLFLGDRGSACCTKITAKSIFPISNTLGTTIRENEELLVAIVHPKTKFPGKTLPKGVVPNTYLSRFIAVLPREPYTIVAKSGAFCLGYPSQEKDGPAAASNSLGFVKMGPLYFGKQTLNCPRIHFVTGMTDTLETLEEESLDDGSVIVSYGVADCLSRFVEIPKSEIIRMLTPSRAT